MKILCKNLKRLWDSKAKRFVGDTIITNLSYNTALSIVSNFFPLLTVPYITRIIDPHNLGEVFYFQSIGRTLIIFCLLGIPIYGVNKIAKAEDIKEKARIICELITITFLLAMILISTIIIIGLLISEKQNSYYYLLCGYVLAGSLSLDWAIQGLEKFKFLAIRNFVVRVLSVLMILFFVNEKDDGEKYFAILFITTLLISLLNFHFLYKDIGLKFHLFKFRRNHLRPILFLFASLVAIHFYTNFDIILLKKLSTYESVARYTLSLRISQASTMIITSISAVFLPFVSSRSGKNDFSKAIEASINTTLIIGGIILIFLIVYSKQVITLMGGKQYSDYFYSLIIIAPTTLIIGLSQIFGIQILTSMQKESKLLLSVILGALVSIAVNLLSIPVLHENGAGLAYLLAELLVLIICFYFSRSYLKNLNPLVSIDICKKLVYFALIIIIIRQLILFILPNDFIVSILIFSFLALKIFSEKLFHIISNVK